MDRRSFVETLGGYSMLAPLGRATASDRKTRFYALDAMYLKAGAQLPRIHDFVSKSLLPALAEAHSGPKIFLEALIAAHMPQFLAIYGFESWEQIWSVRRKLRANAPLARAAEEFERGPEPPFEHQTTTLLEAAEYSPEIVEPETPPPSPRIFELRTYHSPTNRQLMALHERFAGPEIKIFHRSGVHPLFYTSTVIGQQMPNLTYLIPFESLAAREKAWAAFAADEEWKKVRQESIDKHGQISSVIQIAIYRAAPYSPVR
jgi:hypothetical protein